MTELLAAPSRDSVLAKLTAAFLKVTDRDPTSVVLGEATQLHDDLGLDSYAALELLFELEDTVGVNIPQEAAVSFKTVGDVVSYVIAQTSAGQAPGTGSLGDAGAQ